MPQPSRRHGRRRRSRPFAPRRSLLNTPPTLRIREYVTRLRSPAKVYRAGCCPGQPANEWRFGGELAASATGRLVNAPDAGARDEQREEDEAIEDRCVAAVD